MIVPAALLFAATLAVWFVAAGARAAARLQIRFAAILLAALAVAAVLPVAGSAVALLVLPIAFGVLALAVAAGLTKPLPAASGAIVLALFCLGGMAAAVTGIAAFSLAPAALALGVMAVFFVRQFDAARIAALQGLLSLLCFLAAVSAFALEGVSSAMLLFTAAGLLGLTLALSRSDFTLEERPVRDLRGGLSVRGGRRA